MQNGKVSTTNSHHKTHKPYMRIASLKDCEELGKNLRKADLQECQAYGNIDGLQALLIGYLNSNICISIADDKSVIAIFGICGEINQPATIWMLASDRLSEISRKFLRENKKLIDYLNQQYPLLHNVCDARNDVHIKWLKWCGFTFINKQNLGYQNKPFYTFVRTCVFH